MKMQIVTKLLDKMKTSSIKRINNKIVYWLFTETQKNGKNVEKKKIEISNRAEAIAKNVE